MFSVSPQFNVLRVFDSEDLPSHTVPKSAIADIRPSVVMGTDGQFSQHVVVVEKTNGQLITIPMGMISEYEQWTNTLSGCNHCIGELTNWLNS